VKRENKESKKNKMNYDKDMALSHGQNYQSSHGQELSREVRLNKEVKKETNQYGSIII
jgi:hypothetical protein